MSLMIVDKIKAGLIWERANLISLFLESCPSHDSSHGSAFQLHVMDYIADACFHSVKRSLRGSNMLAHINGLDEIYPIRNRLLKIPRNTDMEAFRPVTFFTQRTWSSICLLFIRWSLFLHRTIAITSYIQAWMAALANSLVASAEQFVQLILGGLLDTQD